jgi:aminocarboxymuconate-semialdehyde decarboxylase
VEVASNVAGVEIGDARFETVFREARRLDLTVLVHSLPRADEPGLDASLRGSIGVGLEGARGAASLALGTLAQEEESLPDVLFTHAAGGLPLMLARADYFWGNADPDTRSAVPPSELARRFYYDSMVFDPRGLRFIIDYLGADRIVLGSDYPAMPRRMPLSDTVDDLDLPDEDRERVLSGNARRYLAASATAPVR